MLEQSKKETLEYVANKVREELNLSIGDDPFKIISGIENFIIIRFPSKIEKLSGFSLKKGKYNCIYINSNNVLGRQYYSCWHEYFHCINDLKELKVSYCEDEQNDENEADYFASCMLMPREEVEDYVILNKKNIREYDEDDLIKMQYKFKVSFQSLLFRLRDVFGYESILRYIYLSKVEYKNEYLKRIEKNKFTPEIILPTSDACVSKSFFKDLEANLINGRITISKVEQIMRIVEDEEIKGEWE